MDNVLLNEYRRNFVRQKLASVAPRKISMKNSFLEIFMDFQNRIVWIRPIVWNPRSKSMTKWFQKQNGKTIHNFLAISSS